MAITTHVHMSLARTHGKASSPPLVPSLHLVLWGFGLGDYYHLLFIYDTEEQRSLFSHVVYTPHGCILTCSGSKQCSSFRTFCPDMPCSLCGRQHNLRTCKLPGAAKHRELLANFRHVAGKVKNPQEGRKPPRLGPVTWGKKKRKATEEYSGSAKRKRDLKADQLRRRKGEPLPETEEGQLKAVEMLQKAGYIPRAHRCSHCKWSLGKLYVHNDKHVYRRCCNEDCRRRTNVLTQAKWLQNLCRFSLSPMQLHSLLLQYTGTHVGATASPYVLARSVGTTYKPVAELIQRLRAVESQAGQKMNNRSRMSGAVELDATSLRKIRIGKDTQKYKHLVEQWKKAIGPGWALCLL